MTLVRRIARPLLASTWIYGGAEALRNPTPKVPDAADVAPPIAARIPYLPQDPEQLVKINAGIQLGAGSLLALGKLPRLSALALTGSAVLTTAAGHRFWEERDPGKRAEQQYEFAQNMGLLGGLLLATVDTGGRPSVFWRVRRLGKVGGKLTRFAARSSTRQAGLATRAAKGQGRLATRSAKSQAGLVTRAAKSQAGLATRLAKSQARVTARAATAAPKLKAARVGARTGATAKLAGTAARSVRRIAA